MKRKELIKEVKRLKPLWGSPWTRYNYDTRKWEWNDHALSVMNKIQLQDLLDAGK